MHIVHIVYPGTVVRIKQVKFAGPPCMIHLPIGYKKAILAGANMVYLIGRF